jgi:hypothetical protein
VSWCFDGGLLTYIRGLSDIKCRGLTCLYLQSGYGKNWELLRLGADLRLSEFCSSGRWMRAQRSSHNGMRWHVAPLYALSRRTAHGQGYMHTSAEWAQMSGIGSTACDLERTCELRLLQTRHWRMQVWKGLEYKKMCAEGIAYRLSFHLMHRDSKKPISYGRLDLLVRYAVKCISVKDSTGVAERFFYFSPWT